MINKFGTTRISASTSRTWSTTRARRAATPTSASSARARSTSRRCFAAAKNRVKYYFAERDPVAHRRPDELQPVHQHRRTARAALKSDPAPVLKAAPADVPVGARPAPRRPPTRCRSSSPTTVTRRCTITNVHRSRPTPTTAATRRAGDFAIVSQNCPRQRRPLAPGGTCTVNVGFKPTRTNYTSVARLAVHVELRRRDGARAARRQEHRRRRRAPSAATSRACCRSRSRPGASFGTFVPGAGAHLRDRARRDRHQHRRRRDAVGHRPEHDRSGPPGQRRASRCRSRSTSARSTPRNPSTAFVPLAETAGAPTHAADATPARPPRDPVTVGFRQAIGATDVLRAGTYSKTLTFTLSTTTP